MNYHINPTPGSNPFSSLPPIDAADVLSTLLMEGDRNHMEVAYNLSSAPLFKAIPVFSPDLSPNQTTKNTESIVPEVIGSVPENAFTSSPQLSSMSRGKKRKADQEHTDLKVEEELILIDQPLRTSEGILKELSVEDIKQEKRMKRLAKNREAAQLFRQRQKDYIATLERKANELTSANTEASARVELLSSENKLMREQLVYLRNFMRQAVSFSFPYGVPLNNVQTMSLPASSSTSSSSSSTEAIGPLLALPPPDPSAVDGGIVPSQDLYPD